MSGQDKVFIPEWGPTNDDIKVGETVCEHNKRPFECRKCYPLPKDRDLADDAFDRLLGGT